MKATGAAKGAQETVKIRKYPKTDETNVRKCVGFRVKSTQKRVKKGVDKNKSVMYTDNTFCESGKLILENDTESRRTQTRQSIRNEF